MQQNLRYQAVLFDCDGVLVDSEQITNGVLRAMLHELGWAISAEDCFGRFVGRSLKDQFGVIEQHTGVAVGLEWLSEFRVRRDQALALELEAIPGADSAARALFKAYEGNVACASGADRAKVEMQ